MPTVPTLDHRIVSKMCQIDHGFVIHYHIFVIMRFTHTCYAFLHVSLMPSLALSPSFLCCFTTFQSARAKVQHFLKYIRRYPVYAHFNFTSLFASHVTP